MLAADPWVKNQYEALRNSSNVSSEQMIERLHGLEDKARQVGASITPQAEQDMSNEIKFFQTASARSETMVQNIMNLPGAASGVPVAMIIGAAHSEKVATLLTQKGASFAIISPINLNSAAGSMTGTEYERKAAGKWARNNPGTLGYVLNSHRKPPPIIERTAGQSYASMQFAAAALAQSARSGGPFPDNVLPELEKLPGLQIDKSTIRRDGYDVIFQAKLKQDDGTERVVWARVGTVPYSGGGAAGNAFLEQKLVSAAEALEGGSGGGDGKGGKPKKTGAGGDEKGPEKRDSALADDAQKKGLTVSRISMDAVAVYASRREDIVAVGQISR
jgi:hypothetical protein